MDARARRRAGWRFALVTVAASAVALAIGLGDRSTSSVTAVADHVADASLAASRPAFPPSEPFPTSRRRGESIVREGVIVGSQIEELDATVRPDGSTEAGFPLPIGTDFFLAEDLFLPDPTSPRDPGGGTIGTGRTHCTVEPPWGLVISCDVTFELSEGSTLYGTETIDFRTITPNEPLSAALAVTGGTGQLTGATGACTLTDREDHATSGISFYDCRISQPLALLRSR